MSEVRYVWDPLTDCTTLETLDGITRLVYTSEPARAALISLSDNGTQTYYAADGLHCIRALSDASQNVSDRYTYSYFGTPIDVLGGSYNHARYYGEIGYLTDNDTSEVHCPMWPYEPKTARTLSRLYLRGQYGAHPGVYFMALLWQEQNGQSQQERPPQPLPFGQPGDPDDEAGTNESIWLCCSPLVPPRPPLCHLYVRIIIPSPEPDIIPADDFGFRGGPDLGRQMQNYGCDCGLPWGMLFGQSGIFRPPFPDAGGDHPCVRLEIGQLNLLNIGHCFRQTIERINRCCIQYNPYALQGTCNSNCLAFWLLSLCVPEINWEIPTPASLGIPFGWGAPIPDCVRGAENDNPGNRPPDTRPVPTR